jgi:hypothetical protein
MARKACVAVLLAVMAGAAYAASGARASSWTGYLIDNACAAKNTTDDKVKAHTVSCSLMDPCVKSGYAIYSDGKLYKLDKAGNDKALALLKATSSKTSVQVKVEGTLSGDTIKVKNISEVSS